MLCFWWGMVEYLLCCFFQILVVWKNQKVVYVDLQKVIKKGVYIKGMINILGFVLVVEILLSDEVILLINFVNLLYGLDYQFFFLLKLDREYEVRCFR